LAYADDVGLITGSEKELQDTVNEWDTALKDNGLKLNEIKSEVMEVSISRTTETLHITANGQELKKVEAFKYLGVVYDSTADNETAVTDRIKKYSMNVGLLYPLLKDRHVPRAVKLLIYTSVLRPILTYGCEAWTLAAATKSKVQAAEMRVLRLIKGVTRKKQTEKRVYRRRTPGEEYPTVRRGDS